MDSTDNNLLRHALSRRNVTRDLAAACGVSAAAVSRWGRNGGVPGPHARRAAAFLGYSLASILEPEAPMKHLQR